MPRRGDPGHWAPIAQTALTRVSKGRAARVLSLEILMKDNGYFIFPSILSVRHSPEWWFTQVPTYIFVLISLCFFVES
jgi:hypothetical protein